MQSHHMKQLNGYWALMDKIQTMNCLLAFPDVANSSFPGCFSLFPSTRTLGAIIMKYYKQSVDTPNCLVAFAASVHLPCNYFLSHGKFLYFHKVEFSFIPFPEYFFLDKSMRFRDSFCSCVML